MSEPTIKPSAWMCPRCEPGESTRPASMGPEGICTHAGSAETGYVQIVPVDVPLYTHDDLVRVVCLTLHGCSYMDDAQVEAETIVERLTGVKR